MNIKKGLFFLLGTSAVSLLAMQCTDFGEFKQYGTHYYALSGTKFTFAQAKQIAENNGGYIAIPNDAGENNFLATTFGTAWIGVYDPSLSQLGLCYSGNVCTVNASRFSTVKNTPLSYSNWANGEPNNAVYEYDIVDGKQMVAPLGEHWAVIGENSQWGSFGNHAQESNNPIQFKAIFEFDTKPECVVGGPTSEPATERKCTDTIYNTGSSTAGQIVNNGDGDVAMTTSNTYTCQNDTYGNEYCPTQLAKCDEVWGYQDGYSVSHEICGDGTQPVNGMCKSTTKACDAVGGVWNGTNCTVSGSYQATATNLPKTNILFDYVYNLSFKSHDNCGSYLGGTSTIATGITLQSVSTGGREPSMKNCFLKNTTGKSIFFRIYGGGYFDVMSNFTADYEVPNGGQFDIKPLYKYPAGCQVGSNGHCNIGISWYGTETSSTSALITSVGQTVTTEGVNFKLSYLQAGDETTSAEQQFEVKNTNSYQIAPFATNSPYMTNNYPYYNGGNIAISSGQSFSRAVITSPSWMSNVVPTSFGFIRPKTYLTYTCPSGGELSGTTCNILTTVAPSCSNVSPDGYCYSSPMTYYTYHCSTATNEYGQSYIVQNAGGIGTTNPTPPTNNCKIESFSCVPATDRKCAFVSNQWQCSPFPCFGESNLESADTTVGELDSSNKGFNTDGSCSYQIRLFNGKDMRCRSWDALFGLLGGGCCQRDNGSGLGALFGGQCKEDERLLAKYRKESADRSHYVGEYCSKYLKLGFAKICIQKKKTYCVFNSKLARIIHEQGRPQINIAWGGAKAPNCKGFTPEEFQKIDFSKLDLSEFYGDLESKIKTTFDAKVGATIQQKVSSFGVNINGN